QQQTALGDEVILQNQAILVSLGKLSGEGLERATMAAANMAAVVGIDLKAAMILMAKAAAGETSTLSRYGIVLGKNVAAGEKFARVLELIEERMGGAAATRAKSLEGVFEAMGAAIGDLGETIVEFTGLGDVLKGFAADVKEAAETISGSIKQAAQDDLEREATRIYDELQKRLGETSANTFAVMLENARKLGTVKELLAPLTEALDGWDQGLQEALDHQRAFNDAMVDAQVASERAAEAEERRKRSLDAIIGPYERVASQAEMAAKWQSLLNDAEVAYGESARVALEAALELSPTMETLNRIYKSMGAHLRKVAQEKRAAFEAVPSSVPFIQSTGALASPSPTIPDTVADGLDVQAEAYREFEEGITEAAERAAERRIAIAERESMMRQMLLGQALSVTWNALRAAFPKSKSLAIAQAIINTAQGATKALAQGGIFGPALAAIVVAAGMKQVAMIRAQKFATGGIVSGPAGRDAVPAMLTAGEGVLTQSETRAVLDGRAAIVPAGHASTVHVTINALDGADVERVLTRNKEGFMAAFRDAVAMGY
ncbi:MAG: hypothetical protein Q9Q40_13860, partial [Acidobacteriota bacterium]|nr:hypothetical protein [Acidobacteriota bacterium]